ncbi:hypothetical protein PV05_07207 [Exophiala xenobiotica]|uniref:Het-C-domain-containing protein n=1 Tax=Exophiala xenobiotica TaxID=348802 RepID=A0A0D2BQS2_9EURO|nr:uncharacterized protein PV05_07207 [Exophiala xenobiotica]KIW54876.1 hypothetical protein PV05_07207 [Exophiala xenobiotica]
MALSSSQIILLCAVGIVLLARPAHAFGAGNIGSTSKIEGQNWRHGDLEDTLLTIVAARAMGGKKFGKLDVKRVYFGNWLRDYSQAVDVGTVKYVSAEAIRILLWVLGFMSFGYGSGEFEVTTQRLGCYRPEEHIDNPKDYADNEDARQYDRRLRGPVDERRELSINPQTGLKNYIASEGMGIDTSAGLVRKLFGRSIELGRQYARSKNKKDLYEALRLLGTGSHCLEDYAAHSNYVELALIELGERDVFPHVGRRTQIELREVRHPVYPVVTGTFGGVDFLHSVCGEFDDKTTQSEIEELEGTMQQYQNMSNDDSILQDLLNKIPSGVFGGKDEAGKANELKQNSVNHQMQNARISPRQPEEWTRYLDDVQKQIYPIIEFHDEIMQSITETIEKIPILPDLIEQIQDEINKFVFSLLAPYVVPIINQVKNELNTGSNEIIQSSVDKQHIVFSDDHSSDPTHSMLSKDHFSNILNEPAGKVARQTIQWIVPQIVAAWDDERIDVDRTLNRIIHGVLHHPALRDFGQDGAGDGRRLMFGVVEQWWRGKDEREKDVFREKLSRRGVETGKNHKEGVKDHGHGSNRPLGMANLNYNQQSSSGIAGGALGAIDSALGGGSGSRPSNQAGDQFGKMAGAAVGGGVLGSLVGGIASGIGGNLLGGGLDKDEKTYQRDSYGQDGSYTQTTTQVGHSQSRDRYGQAQYSQTSDPYGQREEYNRFEQRETGGHWQSQVHHEERTSGGEYREETRRYDEDNDRPSHGRRHHEAPERSSGRRRDDDEGERFPGGYGGGGGRDTYGQPERREEHGQRDDDNEYGSRRHGDEYGSNTGYGRQARQPEYSSGYGRQEETGYGGRREEPDMPGGFGSRREEESYGSSGYGGRREETSYERPSGFGRETEYPGAYSSGRHEGEYSSSGMPGGFGQQEQSGYGGGREDEFENQGYGRQDENEGFGRRRYGENEGYGEGDYGSRY